MKLNKAQKIIYAVIVPLLAIGLFVLAIGWIESAICGNWSLDRPFCKDYIDGYSKIVGMLMAVITVIIIGISAFYAINTYRQNAALYRKNCTLEHAKWLLGLYEKFYEKEHLKEIRDKLDCTETTKEVENLVKKEDSKFTDYLNFFEFVAFLKKADQLNLEEINDIFGYYLGCINRHKSVRDYIKPNGYELLDELLDEIQTKKK